MDQRNRLLWACALAACVSASGCKKTVSQDGGADGPVKSGLTDPQIAAVMTVANNGEIQQGNLALMRAQSPDVRSFAKQMVSDYTAANQRLTMILAQQGINPTENNLSAQLTKEAMDALNMLRNIMDEGGADGGPPLDMSGGTGGDLGGVDMSAGTGGDLGGVDMSVGDLGAVDMSSGELGAVDLGDLGAVDLGGAGGDMGAGSSAAFDRAYINVQVMMLARVLGIIDSSLLPNVKDAALQTELQMMRQTVFDHLSMAKDLQSRLGP